MKTLSAFLLLIFAPIAQADYVFASADEGRAILTKQDEFVDRMSPFDRAARLKTDQEVSVEAYLKFVGQHVLEWDEAEKTAMKSIIESVQPALDALALPIPEEIVLIKTTGEEEGGAAYTRSNAIVFSVGRLDQPLAGLTKLFCHELFHVISRANPELRELLYAAIGFMKCDEVEFPENLASRKLTNPDAPLNDHWIRLELGGKEVFGIPILYSSVDKYDSAKGGEFFDYLQLQMLLIEREPDSDAVKPAYIDGLPRLASMARVSGFYEQVGRNTGYIIHPEEILADNFALIVLEAEELKSPEILERIKKVLSPKL
ncbi:MAG: hypothetical protein ACI8UO_002947 [Verrucomicrobiales bacterium]|jgi:hypothetical protein